MAFKITKAALQQALDLWPIIDDPVELIVGVEQGIANWSLWQQQGKNRVPLGFWSRKLPVTQKIYTPFEQQLLAAYWALTETEHLTLNLIVYLRPKIPIMSWISSDPVSHKIGHAQEYSIIKWKWYTQNWAKPGPTGILQLHKKVVECPYSASKDIIQVKPPLSTSVKKNDGYDSLTITQKQHAWFTDGSAKYIGNKW